MSWAVNLHLPLAINLAVSRHFFSPELSIWQLESITAVFSMQKRKCITSHMSAVRTQIEHEAFRPQVQCIIAGDINIDFIKITENKDTADYLNNLLTNSFMPTILMPVSYTHLTLPTIYSV